MKNILLLENDLTEAKELIDIIKDYSNDINIFNASNTKRADELLARDINFDAFFIDISLGNSEDNHDGLKWANSLLYPPAAHMAKYPPICFITAFPDYIYQAVNEIHCFSYILKPYSKQDIFFQLDAIFQKNQNMLLKTTENIFVSVSFAEVFFIHAKGRYLDFHTSETTYRSRQYTLKRLLQILPKEFVLCHKSYIINRFLVDNYDFVNHYVHMKGRKDDIPLSRNFHP